jgi:23S rRNA (cytosine1962-C5)-methyltransferase
MKYKELILKPQKEIIIKNRHRWIFSGAISKWPNNFENGSICQIVSSDNQHLGYGYFNKNQSLSGRILSFSTKDPMQAIEDSLISAINLRENFFKFSNTNGYRLVHGEADGLPGLIVDKYSDVFVIQISTLGMDKLKSFIVEILKKFYPRSIIEKSDSSSRKIEGLKEEKKVLYGEDLEKAVFYEDGIKYYSYFKSGQKTGFFLDQRYIRQIIKNISKDKTILNCFSYTNGFSIAALKGNAKSITSIDSSLQSLNWSKEILRENNFSENDINFICEDVFSFFESNKKKWDIVIIDPPAFAKSQKDISNALKAYEKLNSYAMNSINENGLLITSSCSHFIDKGLWLKVLQKSACKNNLSIMLLFENYLSLDHPLNLSHIETQYLKSAICSVRPVS